MKIQHSDEYESYYSFVDRSENLEHYGKLGMKWGQRLYQNKDGSLTPLGRVHYGVGNKRAKGMKEQGYTQGDYRGYKSYKKVQKSMHGFKDRGYTLRKEAANVYNEDLVRNSAEKEAMNRYYNKQNGKHLLALIGLKSKEDKTALKDLTDMIMGTEDYRMAKEFLDKHKDEFIRKDGKAAIDIQNANKNSESDEVNFEEESKKYGLKSDKYYEEKYKREYEANPKKYDKWMNQYGVKKEDIIKNYKLFDKILKELDPDQKLHDNRKHMAEGYKKDKTFWEYNGKIYLNIYDIINEKTYGGDYSYGKVNGDKHKIFQKIDRLKKSGFTLKEIAKKLDMPENTVTGYYYMFE